MNKFKVYKRLALKQQAGVQALTLSAALTITTDLHGQFLKLTPTATRVVTLPAEEISEGVFYVITNSAASGSGFDLTVKNDNGDTIATLNPVEQATFLCSGTAWAHMGIITVSLT